MGVRFGILGVLEVVSDGVEIRIGGARREQLLAVMLLEADRVVPLPRLIDALWDGEPPPTARTQVHKAVLGLRRLLGTQALVNESVGYRLRPGTAEVDSRRFVEHVRLAERAAAEGRLVDAVVSARTSLNLWRGPALAGLGGSVLRAAAQRLDEQRLAVWERCLDWELELGQNAQVVAELTELVAQYPLRERFRGQLMLALHRAGRQADALELYEHGRRVLARELGLDLSPELRAVHQQVLTGATTANLSRRSRQVSTGDAELAVVAGSPVPRQLPAPPGVFVGRRSELAELDAVSNAHADEGGTVMISAIGGAGGIGKTVLALYWAHHAIDRFPDGQLYVDLRGFAPSGAPTPVETAVRGFLHALGVPPAAIPADLDAQVGLYRSLVSGKRMLVLLDNAHDTAQVEPLLPGSAGCTAVVTSRNQLAGLHVRGAHLVDLDVLAPDEAHHLLTRRLPADRVAARPEAVADLLTWCAGMPLAISIVAARATTHRDFPLTVLADELRDTATRLDALDAGELTTNLRAVCSWSYQALSPPAAGVFRLLGLAPGPDIGLPAAASLAALPAADVRQQVRDLEAAHLVTQHLPGRYQMHDLTRLYATERAGQDTTEHDRRAALHRLVDFYLHTAHTGDRQLSPHRPPIRLDPPAPGCRPHPLADPAAAMAWFDAEHACLLGAQQAAITHGWHQAVWQLAWVLTTFHRRRGHLHDHLAVWRAGLAAARHLDNPTTMALTHQQLGYACSLVRGHREAADHLHQALTLAQDTHDVPNQAHIHLTLAWVWERRGDDQRALEHATHALRVYETLDTPAWEALALNAVGWYAAQLGEYDQARAHCRAALALHRRHHHRHGEATTLDSLGYIAHHTGHHVQAIDYYHQALARYHELDNRYQEANTLDNLGHPHAALDEQEKARAVWRKALDLYRIQHRTNDAERVQQKLSPEPRRA